LNQIFAEASSRKADWVLTLDDDSILPEDLITRYFSCIERQDASVGIVCPLLRSKATNQITHSKTSETECITSGSLTRVSAWEYSGGFDDWLFIDSVDFDFSKRVVNLGMTIVECTQVTMPHEIGKTRTINLGFAHPAIRNHGPVRKYYQERNYPYVDYKYSEYGYIKELLRFIKHTLFVLLWENDKKQKIFAMRNGRKDALIKIKELRHSK
jgi:rhamnosyltransferase